MARKRALTAKSSLVTGNGDSRQIAEKLLVRLKTNKQTKPVHEVKDAFQYIKSHSGDDDRLLALLSYVEKFWIKSNPFPMTS